MVHMQQMVCENNPANLLKQEKINTSCMRIVNICHMLNVPPQVVIPGYLMFVL